MCAMVPRRTTSHLETQSGAYCGKAVFRYVLSPYNQRRTRSPPPRRHGSTLGGTSDLELWAARQMTLREQIAASIGRWALEQPIEHNVEEAREPRFTVPAEPPEPDPGEIDIARVHITAWVAAPCYESEILDFEVCTVAQVNFAVKNTSAQFQDIPMEYVPTIPQLGRDFASYVAFSSWLPETDKVVQVVDATAIGGGTFAAYVQTPFNQQSILMNLVEGWPAGLQAFIGGSDRPMCTGRRYQAVPGNVIKIPGPGMVPRWCEELRAPLGSPP